MQYKEGGMGWGHIKRDRKRIEEAIDGMATYKMHNTLPQYFLLPRVSNV